MLSNSTKNSFFNVGCVISNTRNKFKDRKSVSGVTVSVQSLIKFSEPDVERHIDLTAPGWFCLNQNKTCSKPKQQMNGCLLLGLLKSLNSSVPCVFIQVRVSHCAAHGWVVIWLTGVKNQSQRLTPNPDFQTPLFHFEFSPFSFELWESVDSTDAKQALNKKYRSSLCETHVNPTKHHLQC